MASSTLGRPSSRASTASRKACSSCTEWRRGSRSAFSCSHSPGRGASLARSARASASSVRRCSRSASLRCRALRAASASRTAAAKGSSSGVMPSTSSTRVRCRSSPRRDWWSCWLVSRIQRRPASRRSPRATLAPLIQARLRPEPTSRRSTTGCSSGRPRPARKACQVSKGPSTTASTRARSAPWRTRSVSPRAPTNRDRASTSRDLPAPVSPVSTVKPGDQSRDRSSTRARF